MLRKKYYMLPVKELRASTHLKTHESITKPKETMGRKYLDITDAPSLMLFQNDAYKDDPEFGQIKMQMRVYGVFIRFVVPYIFDCETSRGKTILQCGQSKLENGECAHFALTPNIQDDKLKRIIEEFNNDAVITPKKGAYLDARCNLDSPEKKAFRKLEFGHERIQFVHSRVQPQDYCSSFNQTDLQTQFSGTLEGSLGANDLDGALEKVLRPLEDEYCKKIFNKELTPEKAIEAFYDELSTILTTAVKNLTARLTQLENYYALEKELYELEEAYLKNPVIDVSQIDKYAEGVSKLFELKKSIETRLSYSTNFVNGFLMKVPYRRDFAWLKGFSNAYETLDDDALKVYQFELLMKKIQRIPVEENPNALKLTRERLEEAKNQQIGLEDLGLCQIKNLMTHLFGVRGPDGTRRAPNQTELFEQFVSMTRKKKKSSKPKPKSKQLDQVENSLRRKAGELGKENIQSLQNSPIKKKIRMDNYQRAV